MSLLPKAAERSRAPLRLVSKAVPDSAGRDLGTREYVVAVAAALTLGLAVRLMFVLSTNFPINDGAMFYAMTRDIEANSFRLPAYSSFNTGNIPLAYPPLGFYVAAIADRLTPMSLITIYRFVPLMFASLLVVGFFLLARDMLKSRIAVALAVIFFACLPASFAWMIMGGGMTRAPGFAFAVFFIREIRRVYIAPSRRGVVMASVFGALAVLSHIEMGYFACLSGGVFFVAYGRNRAGLVSSAAVVVLTGALTAPWWGAVLAMHGISPFVSSFASTRSSLLKPVEVTALWSLTGEPAFPLLAALGLAGIMLCLARREYLLPAWMLAILVFDQRAYIASTAAPMALLAAKSFGEMVLPLARGDHPLDPAPQRAPRTVLPIVVTAIAILFSLGSAISVSPGLMTSLTAGQRAAMTWASENTDPNATFAVISGRTWPIDRSGEWFPVLAHRREAIIVQGTEWLPNDGFNAAIADNQALQACANADGDCLEAQITHTGVAFQYVFIDNTPPPHDAAISGLKSCCDGLRLALRSDARYQLVYDGTGATIFRRNS